MDVENGELYRTILDGVSDGVYVVTPDRTITYWNAGAERLTGFTAAQAIGRRCFDGMLNHVDGAGNRLCGARCPLRATMTDGVERQAHVYAHHSDGHLVPLHVRATPIRDKDGVIIGAVETFSDEAHAVAMREQMRVLRTRIDTDALTGLANRAHLDAHLGRLLPRSDRQAGAAAGRDGATGPGTGQRGVGVLFIDADHFKWINDAHGHPTGDAVLRALARTLLAACRPGDLVARYGGEEFVIVLAEASGETLEQVAARVQTLIREMRVIGTDRAAIRLTVSLGGAVARAGETPEDLLGRADQLLYQAKEAGRDRYVGDDAWTPSQVVLPAEPEAARPAVAAGEPASDPTGAEPIVDLADAGGPADSDPGADRQSAPSPGPIGKKGRHAGPITITPHQPGRPPGRHAYPRLRPTALASA